MTTEAPDPRNFTGWEHAFQYPVPVVRKLENQLRSNAGENREKLRSLVGASYRSLLDTAETIVAMEASMGHVESKLARVGQDCNSRRLDRITSNALSIHAQNRSRELNRYTFASQLAVLQNCPVVMARLLKGDGSYLLAAKVLVVSRLLHKTLSQSKDKPPIVDRLRERLGSARQKLLRRIDRRLAKAAGDTATLVESMCAYSLATSSTPTDVLRHFHLVRMEHITSSLRHTNAIAQNGIDALKLCIQTCQDTQVLFPRRLAESLVKLKAHPLVQDSDVRALHELNLDVHERWIGDEARNYTPWPRHDELQRPEAEKIMHQWSKQAIAAFLTAIKTALHQEQRLQAVASLRQDLIETWILSGSRMTGVKAANVLDHLRDTMNNQLESIVRSRTQNLQHVVSKLFDLRGSVSSSNEKDKLHLWNIASEFSNLSNSPQSFKALILNTHQGRDAAVSKVASAFDKWMESVLEVKVIVKSMKEARWDDTFADDVDDSDEELGDSKQTLLNDDDPRLLEDVTQKALADALENLGKTFAQLVSQLTAGKEDDAIVQAVFMLRLIREVGDRIPQLRLQERSTPPTSPFNPELLRPLHAVLATHIVRSVIETYRVSLAAATKMRSNSNVLWEGTPPLPSQPSPTIFRFLRGLEKSMGAYGSDLWAPGGVVVLKNLTCHELTDAFQKFFETINSVDTGPTTTRAGPVDATGSNAEPKKKGTSSPPEVKDQIFKQTIFDMLYVERFVGNSGKGDPINNLIISIKNDSGIDENLMNRLRKNAADYWRKTYLLFALLA